MQNLFLTPNYQIKVPSDFFYDDFFQGLNFLSRICKGGTLRRQNFENLSTQNLFLTPNYQIKVPSDLFYDEFCSRFNFLSQNLYGRYPQDSKFQNSEYEVHQVGPKDSGSQNFSFLAFIQAELVSRQISATATARDRRKKFDR